MGLLTREELVGLLDSLKGTATDFSQGFNSGAVAGFPGWAGDMAYMADTARLALSGEREQAPPSEYVGTTDYIASKAGYPIPGSVAGQLGAAVGGLLSPGPGDLGRFGAVLSAIPFWHGSPHKFDAFDLSKMGTGEGAQAYGWGAYGAEAPDVAQTYQRTTSRPMDKLAFRGVPLTEVPGVEGSVAAQLRMDMDAGKPFSQAKEELAQYLIENDQREELAALAGMAEKDFSILEHEGNLYRGEYTWPDPQKEAATPLTGEDLLQWGRPLSEQPENVRRFMREQFGDDFLSRTPQYQTNAWGTEKGESLYNLLGSQGLASEKLRKAGIPGIRYLDGMSRDGGQGTYNYVMFDDKGIKLLERNGQKIEQFKAKRAGKPQPYKEYMGEQ